MKELVVFADHEGRQVARLGEELLPSDIAVQVLLSSADVVVHFIIKEADEDREDLKAWFEKLKAANLPKSYWAVTLPRTEPPKM